jgi:site-specific DNA recombinase
LYVGRLVWNRQRFIKDPDTGKRVARLNPQSAWIVSAVPHLRIVDDDLWNRVKERQAVTRHACSGRPERARRPIYLFSGLTKCAVCGGGFILSSHARLICFNAHDRGTCTNKRSIKRIEVEARVLNGMKKRMLEPDAFAEFCAGFSKEMNRLRQEHGARLASAKRDIAKLDRRSKQIMELLLNGYSDEAWKRELQEIDGRRAELRSLLAAAESDVPFPNVHPRMVQVFRDKVESLAAALDDEHGAADARHHLRALVQQVVITADDGPLRLVGNARNVLTAAAGEALAAVGNDGCGGRI